MLEKSFKSLFLQTFWAQSFDIWYATLFHGPEPELFKSGPSGNIWGPKWGPKFELEGKFFKNLLLQNQ